MKAVYFSLLSAVALSPPLSTAALAEHSYERLGGSSDGGGKGIACVESNGKQKVYLADTFPIRDSELYKSFVAEDSGGVVEALAPLIDKLRPEKAYTHPYLKGEKVSLAWLIVHQYNQMGYEYVNELADLPDDHIDSTSLPANCRKVQVAIQDVRTGQVRQHMKLVHEMPFLDRGLLDLHETLIKLRNQPGADTSPIRQDVEAIFSALSDPRLALRTLVENRISPNEALYKAGKGSPGDLHLILPTLIRWPRELTCHTVSGNYTGKFVLRVVKGNRRPYSPLRQPDEQVVAFTDAKGKQLLSYRIHFDVYNDRYGYDRGPYGMFHFQALFPEKKGNETVVNLDEYHEFTNEFTGSIWTKKKTSVYDPNNKAVASSQIYCYGERPEFAIDSADAP